MSAELAHSVGEPYAEAQKILSAKDAWSESGWFKNSVVTAVLAMPGT